MRIESKIDDNNYKMINKYIKNKMKNQSSLSYLIQTINRTT